MFDVKVNVNDIDMVKVFRGKMDIELSLSTSLSKSLSKLQTYT